MDKLTVNLQEAASITGIGRCKLEELVKGSSDFPYFRVGTKILIYKESLKVWLEKIATEQRIL